MPIEKIVLNASPIIILYKAQMENILPQLFNDIIIPKAVFDEITKARIKDRGKVELPKQAWYKKVKIGIDDAAARKCARTYNIGVLGTGSILVLAKRRGLIISIEQAIQEIRKAGLWISDGLVTILKEKAGE
jgi:predicted nucleic acid-binding protein